MLLLLEVFYIETLSRVLWDMWLPIDPIIYLFKHVHFLLIFLISGCGLGAYKWRACFPAFISGFYCKKQEKIALNLQAYSLKRAKRNRS